MTDQPPPPPPERRRLVRFRGRLRRPRARLTHELVASGLVDPRYVGRWPKTRKTKPTTRYNHQGDPMPTLTPDYDRPATLEGCAIPQIQAGITWASPRRADGWL